MKSTISPYSAPGVARLKLNNLIKKEQARPLSFHEAEEIVLNEYKISKDELYARTKKDKSYIPCWTLQYLLYHYSKMTYEQIAANTNRKNHTSVRYAIIESEKIVRTRVPQAGPYERCKAKAAEKIKTPLDKV